GWQAVMLESSVTVRIEPPPPPPAGAVIRTIEAVWEAERAMRPRLFNGRIFTADRIEPGAVTGHWTEYKRQLAQIRRPELRDILALRPLAVNGLLCCPEGAVLGRRSAGAVYLAGDWQATPAGSIEDRGDDQVDLLDQIGAELHEELGLDAEAISSVEPVAAVEHAGSRIVDLCFLLWTSGIIRINLFWNPDRFIG
ncbi:MAG: hypothetical protein Q8869_00905, partial [Candidatus Phytoplasma australasiaticum]|nr:hypothetical protein [Candidatus Phytoplasma australasiaticum]